MENDIKVKEQIKPRDKEFERLVAIKKQEEIDEPQDEEQEQDEEQYEPQDDDEVEPQVEPQVEEYYKNDYIGYNAMPIFMPERYPSITFY